MRRGKHECRTLAKQITQLARDLGLIPLAATFHYQPGSVANGIAPYVYVEEGDGHRHASGYGFEPTFHRGYRTTNTDAWIILDATRTALLGAVRLKHPSY